LFSLIVLAGGKSRRLGHNKLQEDIGGKSLIVRVIDTLVMLGGDIIVVTGAIPDANWGLDPKKVKMVVDILPDAGALGGIYTGLLASETFDNLVIAGDMPFLNTALLRYLIDIVGGFDAVVPRLEGYIEPLHAVYTRRCLPHIKEGIQNGQRDIRSFFPFIRVRYVEGDEIDRYDPRHLSFFNINNEWDLEKAREIVKNCG
jgi:molybdopterin-guanine dinucleotide biosynthesis protein A